MPVVLVVARAENGVIGRDGGLPWRLKRDMLHFREVTMGKPVIMGRKTYQSIGKPLKGRDNIVVSRDHGFSAQGCVVVHNFDAALTAARESAEGSGAEEICVIGGAEIYAQALPHADRIHLTEVHCAADGDVRLDAFAGGDWTEIARERFAPEGDDTSPFSFVTLERRAAPKA